MKRGDSMSIKFKGAVLYNTGSDLLVRSYLEASEPAFGQVLVKVAYAGVCHSQLMETQGDRGQDCYLPHLLGHEGTGVVVVTGEGVTKVRAGQKVILGWIKGRGADVPSVQYSFNGDKINAGAITTFNEYALISENRLVPLPDGVPMDIGVLFGCAILTGGGIVLNVIKPGPNKTVALFGLGGVGLSALMACLLYDFTQVIAVDVSQDKLDLAQNLGATHLVNADKTDPVEAIRDITGGKGVDYSIESAGRTLTIEQAFASVRNGGGWCVFASHPSAGEKISLDPFDLISGKRITGTWGGQCDPDRDIPRFAELYLSGKLPLEMLISRRYSLDQINDALDDLKKQKVARPLIEIDPTLH